MGLGKLTDLRLPLLMAQREAMHEEERTGPVLP